MGYTHLSQFARYFYKHPRFDTSQQSCRMDSEFTGIGISCNFCNARIDFGLLLFSFFRFFWSFLVGIFLLFFALVFLLFFSFLVQVVCGETVFTLLIGFLFSLCFRFGLFGRLFLVFSFDLFLCWLLLFVRLLNL